MRSRTIVALVAIVALAPLRGLADEREWEEDYSGNVSYVPSDYDVSVDLNVSGAVTFDTFHGALSPYGDWVVAGSYGRVWRPRVAAGWRPYYYGNWEWTNEGWLWASDEPWGWAAYHYGRWSYDPYYSWVWVPGYEWAPAWVAWRTSGDVIGWAPLAPGLSVYVSTYPFVDFWWTFVPTARFVSYPVYQVAYAPTYSRRYFHETAPAPARPSRRVGPGRFATAPAPAWGGPAPRLIEQRIGRPVVPVRIVAAPAPGARGRPGEIAVYRPEARPAPGRPFPGRGPGTAPAQGVGGAPGRWAPPSRGDGRGPGSFPAPGRGEAPGRWSPPSDERGRGPGAVPAPGHGRASEGVAPPSGAARGSGPAAAPGWSGGRGGGEVRAAPPARAPSRGGEGHGRGERGRRD